MHPVRTFIVEGSPIVLDTLVPTLQEFTSVQVVGSAADEDRALSWLTDPANSVDLIIVDLSLRYGSGLGVLARAAEAGVTGRRVALTSYATGELRRKCLQSGADRVFDRSREVEELIAYCAQLGGDAADPTSSAAGV